MKILYWERESIESCVNVTSSKVKPGWAEEQFVFLLQSAQRVLFDIKQQANSQENKCIP
jgi:hypothetical protein